MRLMEESRQDFDIYRCMAGSAVDTHAMEDDDIADLTGALKYVHTEILTETLAEPNPSDQEVWDWCGHSPQDEV